MSPEFSVQFSFSVPSLKTFQVTLSPSREHHLDTILSPKLSPDYFKILLSTWNSSAPEYCNMYTGIIEKKSICLSELV